MKLGFDFRKVMFSVFQKMFNRAKPQAKKSLLRNLDFNNLPKQTIKAAPIYPNTSSRDIYNSDAKPAASAAPKSESAKNSADEQTPAYKPIPTSPQLGPYAV